MKHNQSLQPTAPRNSASRPSAFSLVAYNGAAADFNPFGGLELWEAKMAKWKVLRCARCLAKGQRRASAIRPS